MEPQQANLNKNISQSLNDKTIKEILEPVVSVKTDASVESAVDQLKAGGSEAAPAIDSEGTLVGKISKEEMIRGVSGRGHDPKTTAVEPHVEKDGEPYCYEDEPIGKAEQMMREGKADEVSVVSNEKKLVGKATRQAVEEGKLTP